MISKPVLKYFGGKWRIGPKILPYLPEHFTYVEPCGGAASVLIQKAPSPLEVYNDLDSRLVTFFRVLREREDELIRVIRFTPWSREEKALSMVPVPLDNELEIARRVYVRCWQSFGGEMAGGWRYQKADNGYSCTRMWGEVEYLHAIASRLRLVQFENDTANVVVQRYDTPETLFFVDPPYVHETRKKKKAYMYEMTDEEHVELLTILKAAQGMVIVCGYESELYSLELKNWEKVEITARNNQNDHAIEVLWFSPAVVEKVQGMQRSLFG